MFETKCVSFCDELGSMLFPFVEIVEIGQRTRKYSQLAQLVLESLRQYQICN